MTSYFFCPILVLQAVAAAKYIIKKGTSMSEETNTDISLIKLPKSVDKAIKNLTDEPTKGIGHTFSDIWYLVFGAFSHAADKRRIKYDIDLKQYEKELTENVSG